MSKNLSRRDFLKGAAASVAGVAAIEINDIRNYILRYSKQKGKKYGE